MTLGVPIVASHIGGIKELVTDGLEGRLVSPNDPGALRQAVTQLLASPSLREGMAAAGRRRSATYSLKALATSIELLYTEAIREADAIGDADA
jgi:glycosyltransferase involved in cell wall biosynthesis